MTIYSGFRAQLALRLNNWTSRWIPSAFSIAVLLTLFTLAFAVIATEKSLTDCIRFWGDGFWELLAFSMQMTLIMVTGYIMVVSPIMNRLLRWVASIPKTPTGAVALTALVVHVACLDQLGFEHHRLRHSSKYMARHHKDVDYRLLVAVAYFGMGCTWHAGLSASAPVLVATPKHFMEAEIGIIPLSQTIFHPFNLSTAVIVIVTMTMWLPCYIQKISSAQVDGSKKLSKTVGVFVHLQPRKENWISFRDFIDYDIF